MWIGSIFYAFLLLPLAILAEDYYELLGVARDADDRTIRKAFKKIAIQKHPDKNKDDPSAHAEFVKINRAYEVLKDEKLRKKYDQYGEEGLKDDFHGGNEYQSWQFYRDNFGIYDDDAEIVTLNAADFQNVLNSGELWFINFYSTYCSHCHELAPTWREFAREMEGVVRIGAVNCAESIHLCQSQQIMGYPSLVVYPDHLIYQGPREVNALVNFIMSKVASEVHHMTYKNYIQLSTEWEKYASKPWVVEFCEDEDACLSKINRRKLSSMLNGIANVAVVACPEHKRDLLCKKLKNSGIGFYPAGQLIKEQEHEIDSLDPKEIYNAVVELMPDWPVLTDEIYEELVSTLNEGVRELTLIRFVDGSKTPEDAGAERELKKLPTMFPDVKMMQGDCQKLSDICSELKIVTGDLPKFLHLMPESIGDIPLKIGTIDCVAFKHLCQEEGVTSYPTSIIYYKGQKFQSIGYHESEQVVEFILDALHPSVQALDPTSFDELVINRPPGTTWVVDFFAPWCGPCQQLAPEYRKLARKKQGIHDVSTFLRESRDSVLMTLTEEMYRDAQNGDELFLVEHFAPWCPPCLRYISQLHLMPDSIGDIPLKIGTIDCVAFKHLCQEEGVTSYPTSIIYYKGQKFQSIGYHESEQVVEFILDALHPSVQALDPTSFDELVINRPPGTTWVVDFFAPWCGPCQQLAPEYRKLARSVKDSHDKVLFGSVDCDAHRPLCQSQQVRSYPTIRLYRHNPSQQNLDYPSNWWRDHGSMQRWVSEFLPSLVEKFGQEFYTEVLQSSEPHLVDFFAPWCGHCVQFAPVFEKIAKMLEGKVRLVKIDCDAAPGVCQAAGIRAYPSVRFYPGSFRGERQEPAGIHVQSQNPQSIVEFVENVLQQHRAKDEL
uniref:DnaJ homolog subfamily C member 10 n=1 Tax=Panagrolaimus sp. JU765 TaxID=591449 RepID=A0AC34RN72_9BILA